MSQAGETGSQGVVGVIGLGVMGRPIARNLLEHGFSVVVWNRSHPVMDALREQGASVASDIPNLGLRAETVITLLPNPATVREVALGPSGLIAALRPGSTFVDMGTGDPDTAIDLYGAGRKHDVEVLDAPVSGGEEGAKSGSLSIMVGGTEAGASKARPVLEALGTVEHVGGPGAGQTVKAANQMIVGGVIGILAEAIILLERVGIDPVVAMRAMSRGMASTQVMQMRGETMTRRSFAPGARAALHLKDLGIALDLAKRNNVVTPLTATVEQLFRALVAQGGSGLDHSALVTVIQNLSEQH